MGIRFEIEAHFDWCKIFDGEMRSPMQCQLALFNSYSLIYIDMTAKQAGADNLNIFKLLNHAFHLDLPEQEAPLLIQDAGFFTFSNHATPPETEKLCNIFPQIPLPTSVTETETPVSHSCTFWLTLRLKGNYLFNNLIEVGVKNGDLPQADISLNGRLIKGISAGESIKKSLYTVVLPDFKLFNIFGFNNLILKYQFDNYAKYEIEGIITLELFQKTYYFDGALSADEKQVQASLQICHKSSESTIVKPFDRRMTGVTFDDLSFGIDYTFAVPEKKQPKVGLYWVKGTINYAKLLALSGSIYLLDNTPILASVAINKDLSIHDIFEASFSSPTFSWPSDFIDIVFHPGSNLYYRRETDGDIKQENTLISSLAEKSLLLNQDITHYQPGFHLHALFDITLIETLKLKGDMQITKEGVNAKIQILNPISLFVLQITGFEQDPGPTLFFSTVKENKAPNGKVLFNNKQNHNNNSFILPIVPELAAGVYTWSVAATKQDFTSSESQLQQYRLPMPELDINLEIKPLIKRDIDLILKWSLVTDASHYNVQIEGNGQTENLSIAAPQSSMTIIFDKLKPAGQYHFSLATLNNPDYIASEFCQVQQWLRLDTPQQIQANYQSGGIEIQWQCCPDITHYLLSLQDPNRAWIQQTVHSPTGQARIALPPIPIAGTYQLYLASMPDTTATSFQIPSIWSDGVAIQVAITPEQIAQSAYQQQMSGNDCGKLIIESFPDLKMNMLATAMAQAGYIAVEIGRGLKSAYPSISANEMAAVLLEIYGRQ
ncbi:hypothetical protein BB987_15725 [Photorhabdus temperata]|uniref:Uncharacterized protein n=1 Tax=Photorhabdus khanii NC19 TaxID=1004151 RepID=W3V0J9_9GAMM|nr:hypothetical protein [Photorhabdus khanii]ETS29347.1 hypothetical protein PTE_04571 [Photorhabdus khanii NC19]OHV51837.1 hypothetical protein BB987_15725 [Photorhabdus temperata]